ncbi:MAG TPA: hypothetical protein VL393_05345 [Candidatus Binataceae bacterium]|jgi:hypothetical protein|nr:hypothetical protein [Candidatus Binataceae bacterium]
MRTIFRAVLVALSWIGLFTACAYAHGGIAGPDDLGPPIITSAVLGVGGYWLMLMWPSRHRPAVNDKKRKPMRGGAK